MNRGLLLAILSVFTVRFCFGQTDPQFTQYMYNQYTFNPAYAASHDALDFHLLYRSQYVNLASKVISTQGFNLNMPLYGINSGIGVTAINDLIGYQRSTYVSVTYDYRAHFKFGTLGVGVNAGIIQASLNGALLRTPDGVYSEGVNHNDPTLPTTLQQGIAPDISLGLYLNNLDKYFAGISFDHILYSSATIASPQAKTKLNFSRDIFITGGYNFKLGSKFALMPSAIIKTDFKEIQTDFGAMATIIDNIMAGISLRGYDGRSIDALALIFGFRYKGFQLLYSYDAGLSYLRKFDNGSHEVSVGYRYVLKPKKSQGYFYYNPRFNP